jgi:hypothetical protein
MPRQPTGNPRGRPRGSGSGVGDEAPRLTVRLPFALYARLEAFAETYKYHRGDPLLAGCVREMITFCLDHADICRQPEMIPTPPRDHGDTFRQPKPQRFTAAQERSEYSRQPRNTPMSSEGTGEATGGSVRQPEKSPQQVVQWHSIDSRLPEKIPGAPEGTGDIFGQPKNGTSPVPQAPRTQYRQPEKSPTFDTTRFFLGALCSEAHRYQGQAHSLRYLAGDQHCVPCRRERNRRYNAAKRERQTWQQTTPQRGEPRRTPWPAHRWGAQGVAKLTSSAA